jgi:hypothetical protein
VLDGFAVVQEYQQKRNGQISFTGHCVMAYNAPANAYQMHWWDNMGTPVNVFHGGFDGEALSLTCENAAGHSRCRFDLSRTREGRYGFLMEVSPDGQQWFPFMEGAYRRA